MNYIEIAAIIVFVILLIVAVVFLLNFYICDNGRCKAFYCAEERGGPKGSFDHLIALLGEMGNDGIWCFPFIGATIVTAMVFWFLEIEFTVRTFAIMWFVCFVVNYILFAFYNHHYLKPLAKYIAKELNEGKGCRCGYKDHHTDVQSEEQQPNIDSSSSVIDIDIDETTIDIDETTIDIDVGGIDSDSGRPDLAIINSIATL